MIIPNVNDLDETLSMVWAGKTTIPTNYNVLESTDVTKTTKQNNNKNLLTYGGGGGGGRGTKKINAREN